MLLCEQTDIVSLTAIPIIQAEQRKPDQKKIAMSNKSKTTGLDDVMSLTGACELLPVLSVL